MSVNKELGLGDIAIDPTESNKGGVNRKKLLDEIDKGLDDEGKYSDDMKLLDVEKIPDNKGLNKGVLNAIDSTSEDVIKILIPEEFIVSRIIYNILEKLYIVDKSIRIKLGQLIRKYINKRTQFYYDNSSREVIGLALEGNELKELFKELFTLKVEDKYFEEIKEVNKTKTEKIVQLNKIGIYISKIDESLNESNQRLFQLESRLAILEDKGETDEDIYNNIVSIKSNLAIFSITKEDLLAKKTELENMIVEIDKILQELEEYKIHEVNERMQNLNNELINFSFSYKLKETELQKDKTNKERSYKLGKTGKRIIYSLVGLIGILGLIKLNNNRNQNLQIVEEFNKSMSLQGDIEKEQDRGRVENLAKVFPKKVIGLEKYKVVRIEKGGYDFLYKGETTDKDIYYLEINIFYIKNGNEVKENLGFYFYRKDLNSGKYGMIIKTINDNIGIICDLDEGKKS